MAHTAQYVTHQVQDQTAPSCLNKRVEKGTTALQYQAFPNAFLKTNDKVENRH